MIFKKQWRAKGILMPPIGRQKNRVPLHDWEIVTGG